MSLPPKPKGKPNDLAEVERALSVLQGRHPEHERVRREDLESRNRRAAAIDEEAHEESTQARSRFMRLGAIGLPIVALLAFVALLGRREMGRRERLEAIDAPYRAFGFATVERSSPSANGSLETSVEPGCLLAVSSDSAPIKMVRGGVTTEGVGPVLLCTCASERVALSSAVASGGGLLLMRADAAAIGGSRAFTFAPFKTGSTVRADEACSDASLDAWIDAKHAPAAPTDGPWLAGWSHRAALMANGFKVVADASPTTPFVVVLVPKESCVLATSSVAGDRLGLRLKGAVMPIADAAGTVARCAQAEETVLVSREGKGELVVMTAPAAGLGGMQGLREVARESGIALGTVNVPAADRPWDAKQTLLASQIPDGDITVAAAPDVSVEGLARVVALSFETPGALMPEMQADHYSYCDPPLDTSMREATCVFSGSQKWRTEGGVESVAGLARAKLPFWLFAMQTVNEPTALKGMTQLFKLARRLSRDGFSPTTLEALTELPNGVEVLGRTGEDAIVAVGVAPSEPWVYTLTDGAAWGLDDAPRVVAVKALQKVTLTTSLKVLPPKASRRSVIFRRQKH